MGVAVFAATAQVAHANVGVTQVATASTGISAQGGVSDNNYADGGIYQLSSRLVVPGGSVAGTGPLLPGYGDLRRAWAAVGIMIYPGGGASTYSCRELVNPTWYSTGTAGSGAGALTDVAFDVDCPGGQSWRWTFTQQPYYAPWRGRDSYEPEEDGFARLSRGWEEATVTVCATRGPIGGCFDQPSLNPAPWNAGEFSGTIEPDDTDLVMTASPELFDSP